MFQIQIEESTVLQDAGRPQEVDQQLSSEFAGLTQLVASCGLVIEIPGNLSLTKDLSTVSSLTHGGLRYCLGNMYLCLMYVHVHVHTCKLEFRDRK